VLAFIGITTFERLVQSSIEDIAYARRIGLLRGFYLELAPELEPYFALARATSDGQHPAETPKPSHWQLTLTMAGTVAVVNGTVIGAFAGLLLQTLGVGSLVLTLVAGATVGAVAVVIQRGRHRRALDAASPDAIDQAAIFAPAPHETETN
jgi:ribose/xylose/arabinose/galactoside ABC-type transport system permease subunit